MLNLSVDTVYTNTFAEFAGLQPVLHRLYPHGDRFFQLIKPRPGGPFVATKKTLFSFRDGLRILAILPDKSETPTLHNSDVFPM